MRHLKDEEIVRSTMAKRDASPLEKELAFRVHRLNLALEAADDVIATDFLRGEIYHGTIQ